MPRWLRLGWILLVVLAPPATSPSALPALATASCSTERAADGWALSSTAIDSQDSYSAFVGNGYLGQRIPVNGTGYWASEQQTGWPLYTPRYDGSYVSGLYAHNTATTDDRQVIAALPTWTGLTIGIGAEVFTSATPADRISHYRQTLLLRCGLVRTSLTWTTTDGRATDLVYEVFAARDREHTAAVRLRMTPHWSGDATVTDLIDGRGARMLSATGGGRESRRTMTVGFRADGTGTRGAVASTLTTGPTVRVRDTRPAGEDRSLSNRQSVGFPVRGARTYTLTKYVGVDTALTAFEPRQAAVTASQRAAARGWPALFATHTAAWAALWRSGIEAAGQRDLQAWIRASEYGMLANTRASSGNSIAPTGLTSDNYAGLVFWDADTWMFPALLANQPQLARGIVDYRYRTRVAARANAERLGYPGLFYSWTSGGEGDLKECHSWGPPPHCLMQIHLQSDIAMAVWQYYQATGDRDWLRKRGWPVLKGIAEFWTGRVTGNADGSYSIKNVAGPDEYSNGVTDGAFTNAGAATALRDAAQAARVLGHAPPADWTRIADRLRIPYDSGRHVFEQYAGYDGSKIKQADTVMLMYPLQWPMTRKQAAGTLDYYAVRTDPEGPAMTDAIHAIDAAALDEPGCSTYTYLMRSIEPFVRGPFHEFSEARGSKAGADDPLAGAPAQNFLTGAGGFLQTFTYGLAGLRWAQDRVRLDPVLPPQLKHGVKLKGLRWQGRTFDVAVGPRRTTVRLTSGKSFEVGTAEGARTVAAGAPAVLETRRPDLAATTNAARCATAADTSGQPGLDARAAVDGSTATAWVPAAADSSLTVDLGRARRVTDISPEWTSTAPTSSTTLVSTDGRHWSPADSSGSSGELRRPTLARYVRLTLRAADSGDLPGLAELTVRQAAGN
ncbi:discoidin domain-containing protein [Streptomyces sp. NPDC006476]|uniref:discoidin domain-containing protein n=1 Tax=Streptomyces sp. NPDC006476 TaxID=3157175 RepID=UPI0033B92948